MTACTCLAVPGDDPDCAMHGVVALDAQRRARVPGPPDHDEDCHRAWDRGRRCRHENAPRPAFMERSGPNARRRGP